MKPTDRYIVELPRVMIKKISSNSDGTPVIEAFAEFGGATYDGVPYEGVMAIEEIYANTINQLAELAKLGLEPTKGPPPSRGG